MEWLAAIIGGAIVTAVMSAVRAKDSRQIHVARQEGQPIEYAVAVRTSDERWRHGHLQVGRDRATWRPLALHRGGPETFLDLTPRGDRKPTFRESILVNPRARILVLDSAGGRVELAIMKSDVDDLLSDLAS